MTAQAQQPVSAAALYSSELRPVYAFLYRLGVRGNDLEDVAHDVFVTAIKRLDTFDATRPVRPWVLGIAFRTMSEHRRRRSDGVSVDDDSEELVDDSPNAEARLQSRQAKDIVDLALTRLPRKQREVLVMCDLEGMPAADIAEALGCPVQTVYSRLRVARPEFTLAVRRIQQHRGES